MARNIPMLIAWTVHQFTHYEQPDTFANKLQFSYLVKQNDRTTDAHTNPLRERKREKSHWKWKLWWRVYVYVWLWYFSINEDEQWNKMCWRIMMKKKRNQSTVYLYITYKLATRNWYLLCWYLEIFRLFFVSIFRNTRVWWRTHTYKYHLIQQRQTKRLISLRLLHLHNRWDDNKSNLWRILWTTLFSNENENRKHEKKKKNHPELPQKKTKPHF